eukprot:TRINITY_DN10000_c0_g1_i1.p1 TRINITY_DN10000_c0_g1~~TRINITY_DN10000_c0_g1_i1.p1  ORF type:complete len:420 (+),score=152.16 TRINITY_DN10000_c0_g1_i1:56-1315(+)
MSDSEDEAPPLMMATGTAGAKSGMTTFEIQQAEEALVAQGHGKPGVDWKVPVSIVTGFLGSGKSTLVQHILTVQQEKKIAVMVNEFGDSNDIERAMRVTNKDGTESDDWVEMSNGCMCCKFKDGAVEALENLCRRKGRFDHIVIETSGLADPGPLITMFWQDLDLQSPLLLHGVVTLVDAKNILAYLGKASTKDDHGEKQETDGGFLEATQQISLADSIVINKADLVPPETLVEVKRKIQAINPDTPMQVTSFSKVLDINGLLAQGRQTEAVPQKVDTAIRAPHDHHHDHHGHTHDCEEGCTDAHDHTHTADIGSVTVETHEPLPSAAAIDVLMKRLLWDTKDEEGPSAPMILRLKALFHIKDAAPVVVQAVNELYDTNTFTSASPLPHNRIVLIGRNLHSRPWDDIVRTTLNNLKPAA